MLTEPGRPTRPDATPRTRRRPLTCVRPLEAVASTERSRASRAPARRLVRIARRISAINSVVQAPRCDPPARTASAMSWVTSTIVRCSAACTRRNSACSSARVIGIERAERLVHQQHRRIGRQRARHADALALAARQLVGPAARETRRREADQRQQLVDARRRPSSAGHRSSRGTVAMLSRHRQVRKETDVLDDVADAAAQARSDPSRASAARRRCTSPASGSSSRLTSRRRVVLPEPLRPTSATVSPGADRRSTRRAAPARPPRLAETSRTGRRSSVRSWRYRTERTGADERGIGAHLVLEVDALRRTLARSVAAQPKRPRRGREPPRIQYRAPPPA